MRHILKTNRHSKTLFTNKNSAFRKHLHNNSRESNELFKRELFQKNYDFSEIGISGLDKELSEIFKKAFITRAFGNNIVDSMGIKHKKGILLYGPPGTGKTLIAKKISKVISNIDPVVVNGPEIMNKYVGESEGNIRKLFSKALSDINKSNLHVIIFDEIDAICCKRGSETSKTDSIVNQLLTMLDGVNSLDNIFVIAMTNRKDLLDDALLRSGRLELHIYIGLPDVTGRKQILKAHTKKMIKNNYLPKDIDLDYLASITENFSGADLEAFVSNAASRALHTNLQNNKLLPIAIHNDHFIEALHDTKPMFEDNKTLINIMPEKYYTLSKKHTNAYEQCVPLIKKNTGLRTILITGLRGSGKTTLIGRILSDLHTSYTQVITSSDTVLMNNDKRVDYYFNIFNKARAIKDSVVVIDDIDTEIEYSELGSYPVHNNKLYQVILKLIKMAPQKDSKLTVIVTCNILDLGLKLADHFDTVFDIETLSSEDITNIELQVNKKSSCKNKCSIKELKTQFENIS